MATCPSSNGRTAAFGAANLGSNPSGQTIRHALTGTPLSVRHDGKRLVGVLSPLERFRKYCRFEPETGCVVWIGGRVRGRGKHGWYGAFSYQSKGWRAHRWAAKFIHGLDIDDPGTQVDHCCPHIARPNTLCVEHLQVVPAAINRELQWIRAEVGIDEPPPPSGGAEPGMVPFHAPPAWLEVDRPVNMPDEDCPF